MKRLCLSVLIVVITSLVASISYAKIDTYDGPTPSPDICGDPGGN